jgi:uncharacterized coiled-coil protein SlyX
MLQEPANEIVSQVNSPGGYLVGLAVAIGTALGGALKLHARLVSVETKLADAEKALHALQEQLDEMKRDGGSEQLRAVVQRVVGEVIAPYQDRVLEVREKVADLSGLVRGITGKRVH